MLNKSVTLSNSKHSPLVYLVAFFVIIEGPIIWHYLTPGNLSATMTRSILYILCILYILSNKTINRQAISISVFFMIYLFVYLLGARQGMHRSALFVLNMIIPFAIYPLFCSSLIRNNEVTKFVKAFTDIMIFLAAISILFWVFGTIYKIMPFRKQITYIWGGGVNRTAYTYLNIYYETDYQLLFTNLMNLGRLNRNVGIFCEAPGYALYLDFALAIELLINPKVNKKRISLLIIAAITSFSIKAYIFILMAFFLRIVIFSSKKNRVKYILTCICFPILLVLTAVLGNILINDKIGTSAGTIRLDDLQAGLLTFKKNPIWGSGFYDNNLILSFTKIKRPGTGLSMGTTFLAHGGLYMMLLYLGAIYAAFSSKILKPYKKQLVIFTVLIIYEFISGNEGEFHIFLMMVSLSYTLLIFGHTRNNKFVRIQQLV